MRLQLNIIKPILKNVNNLHFFVSITNWSFLKKNILNSLNNLHLTGIFRGIYLVIKHFVLFWSNTVTVSNAAFCVTLFILNSLLLY